MSISTPLTKERLKNHFAYNAWKYLVLCLCAIMGWSLIYTQTAYRSPQNKRIDVYIKSSSVTEELMNSFFEPIWKQVVPDMELVSGTTLLASSSDDYYSQMQLTVYIAAGDGDIYFLPISDYKSFATTGAFLPLEDLVESGAIDATGLDLSAGWITVVDEETGVSETHLYGIPTDALYGFMDGLQLDNRGTVMSILYNNQNDENVVPFFNALIQASRADKPEWLDSTPAPEESAMPEESAASDQANPSAETAAPASPAPTGV